MRSGIMAAAQEPRRLGAVLVRHPAARARSNLADASAKRIVTWQSFIEWAEGYVSHAPVGSFAANGFGPLEMHGDVSARCRDRHRDDGRERPRDGLRRPAHAALLAWLPRFPSWLTPHRLDRQYGPKAPAASENMMQQHHLVPSAALAALVLLTAAPAQVVHQVGSGGLPEIRDAIAQSSAGDVITVGPGSYAHFVDDVGVTVRALLPGTVTVQFDPTVVPVGCQLFCLLGQTTRFEPPPGAESHVAGIRFFGNTMMIGGFPVAHRVTAIGRVTFDDCAIEANGVVPLICSGALHLQDTTVSAWGVAADVPALRLLSGDLTATNSLFYGADAPLGFAAGAGIEVVTGRVHASGIAAVGGNQLGGTTGGSGIDVGANGVAIVIDSVTSGGLAGCGLFAQGGTLQIGRSNIINYATNCLTVVPHDELLGVSRAGPVSLGAPFQLAFRALPNTPVGVFAGVALGGVDLPGVLQQPAWLAPATANVAGLVVTDASGVATITWQLPFVPGLVGARLWFQGVAGASLPLQGSPLVGSIAR